MCFVFEVYGDERAREVRAGRCAWRATLTGTYVSVRGKFSGILSLTDASYTTLRFLSRSTGRNGAMTGFLEDARGAYEHSVLNKLIFDINITNLCRRTDDTYPVPSE